MGKKVVKGGKIQAREEVRGSKKSYNGFSPVWVFSKADRDGDFAFDVRRTDFDSKAVLEKIVDYSSMTWGEICSQTHDDGKSKHHFLDYGGLSSGIKRRIEKMGLGEYADVIFSFALNNVLRIIGIRQEERFLVLWYDPQHEAYPSKKKHT